MASVLALVTFKVYPPEMGGQKGVALFYEHLAKHHNIVLAVSADNGINTENVYPVLFPNKTIFKNVLRLSALRKIIRKHNAVAVIAEHSYPGWIAWLVARSFNIPFIIHSHNIEALRFQKMDRRWWKAYWHYEKWIHRKADHNFFISAEDMEFAIRYMGVDPLCCTVITYGTIENVIPEKPELEKVFLFNGSLDYLPNEEALHLLIDEINPILRSRLDNYKILITGKGASNALIDKIKQVPEAEFLGFVDDLSALFSRVRVFINPVLNETGIKTKVVEAIGHHCTVVSTTSGASGMRKDLCGNKLKVVPDRDWKAFVETMVLSLNEEHMPTPAEYFRYYAWENIAARAASDIDSTVARHLPAHINDRI